MSGSAKGKNLRASLAAARVPLLLLVVTLFFGQTRLWGFVALPEPASGQIALASPSSVGEITMAWHYDTSDCLLAAKSPVTMFRRGSPVETTAPMDWAMMSDNARIALTVERYGFNFNKGQVVRAGGDLGTDIFGKTVFTDPRTLWVW